MSLQERAKSAKTLICLLQSLIGRKTRIDLRNDSFLLGIIESVDSFMNIELSDAIMTSSDHKLTKFEYFFVKGTRIRLVHIPEDIDIIQNIEKQLALIQSRRKPISLKKTIDPKT
jgi:small nuclear ribonucleoprotein (snRNP)-like protein